MQLFRKFRINTRLMFGFSLLLAVGTIVTTIVVNSVVSEALMKDLDGQLRLANESLVKTAAALGDVSIRNNLRGVAEKDRQIIEGLYRKQKLGALRETEAKALARDMILSQTVGQTGYTGVVTSKGRIVVHPVRKLLGTSILKYDFGRSVVDTRRGYMEYEWKNPGEENFRRKSMYVAYFAPWDWIIIASAYRDEFTDAVSVDDLQPLINSLHFGKEGYSFILTSDGSTLVHPSGISSVFGLKGERGLDVGAYILNERNGKIFYWWRDSPDAPAKEKLALFREVPRLGWIVVSTVMVDDLYAPLKRVTTVSLIIGGCILLLVLSLSVMVARSINAPLRNFVQTMDAVVEGDMTARCHDPGSDEIGRMARNFDRLLDHLVSTMTRLEKETDQRMQEALQRKLFEEVFENALEGICITDEGGTIVAVNPAFTMITGYSEEEVKGRNPKLLKSNRHSWQFYARMWEDVTTVGHWAGEIWNRRKNGEIFPEFLSISAIRDDAGAPKHYVSVFHDMTDEKRKDEQLYRHAYHDALTGLPNRELLLDRMTVAVTHAEQIGHSLGIAFVDLDNFKNINDSLGHPVGDSLLQKAARRLQRLASPADTVARHGGDEFVLLLENVGESEFVSVAKNMLQAFERPFEIEGQDVYATMSIGISMYPDDAEDAPSLLRNAEIAMYQAKKAGKNSFNLFAKEMNERVSQRLQLEGALRRAISHREFVVYYQPKIALNTGAVVGAEALVRWISPDGKTITPDQFIPLAEEVGLIVPLGEQVLEIVCEDMSSRPLPERFRVAVNLSTVQLRQETLMDSLRTILNRYDVDPSRMELEITESVLMQNIESTARQLHDLVEMGFSLSIDDFGTGHSSLYYLKELPIDSVKIDRSFINDIVSDPSDALIVQTIILMAGSLNLSVVAEGVETEAQADLLRSFGCGSVQGYLFAKPMPFREFHAFLKASKS